MQHPTKATPGGCVFVLLSFPFFGLSGICIWGAWTAGHLPPDDPRSSFLWKFLLAACALFLLGSVILCLGWKTALRANMDSPDDQQKPSALLKADHVTSPHSRKTSSRSRKTPPHSRKTLSYDCSMRAYCGHMPPLA